MTEHDKLAILGGPPAVPRRGGRAGLTWPVVTEADEQAVLDCLRAGDFTCLSRGGHGEVERLERDWASHIGSRHCVAVSNGTTGLALALAALGVGPGDEVLVPALSFVASAFAPLHLAAVPVFVDVDPVTYNLDLRHAAARVSPRTRAVMPVHLHGLPADMDGVRALADRHGLGVVEDAAQAHGATYGGRQVGTLGDVSVFSLNVSKNLPTCGEGGLVTTGSDELHASVLAGRQFGERAPAGRPRDYVHETVGWNAKLSSVQAAFTRSQLRRFDSNAASRQRNVTRFLDRLGGLRGLRTPVVPADRSHAWHILRFRTVPAEVGLDVPGPAFRRLVQRALHAEGVPVREYQTLSLPEQPVFRDAGATGDCPVAAATVRETFTLQHVHLHPDSGPVLDRYADAFAKVFSHLDALAAILRRRTGGPVRAARS
jgi:perosamine synthetase